MKGRQTPMDPTVHEYRFSTLTIDKEGRKETRVWISVGTDELDARKGLLQCLAMTARKILSIVPLGKKV